jgi:LCP family protein required for cell wall assembly
VERPEYTKYRTRPSLFRRRGERVAPDPAAPPAAPALPGAPGLPGRTIHRRRRRVSPKRVAAYLALALLAWVLVSAAAFLLSAQIQQGGVADDSLGGGGLPPFAATNVLVLGSDVRPRGTREAGAQTSGNGRSDSILLLRAGGGDNARLSIARDTLVDIPGHGRQKINAAMALGGPDLAVRTVEQYTGVNVHHVILVSFDDFPDLIDAMGGIDYRGGCVIARVNGGYANGGVTIRIRAGETEHLNGRQALALARVRNNSCRPNENDLTRARRQQRILAAMRGRAIGPHGFIRGPWIGWQVPRTFRTDMSGPTLMGLLSAVGVGGTPETSVLGTPTGEVPEALRQRAVRRFLRG